MEEITIDTKFKNSDIYKVSLILFYSNPLTLGASVFSFILIILWSLSNLEFIYYMGASSNYYLLIALVFLLLPPYLLFIRVKNRFLPKTVSESRKFQLMKDKVIISGESGTFKTEFAWSRVLKIVELKNCILLYLSKGTAYFIAKEAFTTEQFKDFTNTARTTNNIDYRSGAGLNNPQKRIPFICAILLLNGLAVLLLMNYTGISKTDLKNLIDSQMIYVKGGHFEFRGQAIYRNQRDTLKKQNVKSFYIDRYLVTQGLWEAIMPNDPSRNSGCTDCPVENVSWDDVTSFIKRLNKITGENYRLPTDTEFVYAAKGGIKSKHYIYSGSDDIDVVAWYRGNSNGRTHIVAEKPPNELGLYDMSGEVQEFCSGLDFFGYDISSPYLLNSTNKTIRGGGFYDDSLHCVIDIPFTSTYPNQHLFFVGFRLAKDSVNN